MPQLLTNGQKTPKERALEILRETNSKKWKNDVIRLRDILAAL